MLAILAFTSPLDSEISSFSRFSISSFSVAESASIIPIAEALTVSESSFNSCKIMLESTFSKVDTRSATALLTALSSTIKASEIEFSSILILAFQAANLIFASPSDESVSSIARPAPSALIAILAANNLLEFSADLDSFSIRAKSLLAAHFSIASRAFSLNQGSGSSSSFSKPSNASGSFNSKRCLTALRRCLTSLWFNLAKAGLTLILPANQKYGMNTTHLGTGN